MKIFNNAETVICSIEIKDNSRTLFDCDGKQIYRIADGKKYLFNENKEVLYEGNARIQFNRIKNAKYRDKLSDKENENLSVIWVLTGKDKKEEQEKILQVGRNNNFEAMLSGDINPDTNAIMEGDDSNKYHRLKYVYLTFYQIDVDTYLEDDVDIFRLIRKEKVTDLNLKRAIYKFKASYVEGKLATKSEPKSKPESEQKGGLWNPSGGIDGDIFEFLKTSK